jgi:hypothetical protein
MPSKVFRHLAIGKQTALWAIIQLNPIAFARLAGFRATPVIHGKNEHCTTEIPDENSIPRVSPLNYQNPRQGIFLSCGREPWTGQMISGPILSMLGSQGLKSPSRGLASTRSAILRLRGRRRVPMPCSQLWTLTNEETPGFHSIERILISF